MAYSKLITDPRFKEYIRKRERWSLIFSIALAVIAIAGFYINGENSSEISNPESLHIGIIVGGIFMSIGIITILSRRSGKTWDGGVIKKSKKLKKRNIGDNNQRSYQEYMQYTVTIRRDNGKIYEIVTDDCDVVYNYYRIGDRVRRHKSLNTYEKYDKSKDKIIFCNACSSLCDIKDKTCHRCGCPLLK
jgi:uncharacterized membrane protein (DUF485 family)